jgi:hypothetical protein
MRKILFIASHLNSGSNVVYKSLDKNSQEQGFKSSENNVYMHPLNLLSLMNCRHKLNNSSAIFMDELLFNYCFQIKSVYTTCKFIYVIRDAEPTLNLLVESGRFGPLQAQRYYLYRLRRLCEMAKKTPGAIVLNSYDIKNKKGCELITHYLDLIKPFEYSDYEIPEPKKEGLLPSSLVKEADESFEKYLYFLKNQDLNFI